MASSSIRVINEAQAAALDSSHKQRIKRYFKAQEGSIALFLLLVIILLFLFSLLAAFVAAPIVTTFLILCLLLSTMFVCTESRSIGIWHHNRESENRFWCVVSIIFTSALLFSPDSPTPLGLRHPLIGLTLVLSSALYVNYYDRALSRTQLARSAHLKRVNSLVLVDQATARQKLITIQECIAALDYKFVAMKSLNQPDILRRENLIIDILEVCSEEELNYIVTNVNLSMLFYKVKDKDVKQ